MSFRDCKGSEIFGHYYDIDSVMRITLNESINILELPPLVLIEKLADFIVELLDPAKDITAIIYTCPIEYADDLYEDLFNEAQKKEFGQRIKILMARSQKIFNARLPIIGIIDQPLNSIQVAPLLWSHYIIGTRNTKITFPDTSNGIFPGLGATVYATNKIKIEDAATLLIKGTTFDCDQALKAGLLDEIATDGEEALILAKNWIFSPKHFNQLPPESDIINLLAPFKKKVNPKFPGYGPCLEIMERSRQASLRVALQLEAKKYTAVLRNPSAVAIMRTTHYGVKNAQNPVQIEGSTAFQKIGIIGAGMMGAGIAYEVARAGIQVWLKDMNLEQAQKGKQYTVKCCDRLISLGKITEAEKESILSCVHPTDNTIDLTGADCIIEAVFEQEELKESVIQASAPLLNPEGIFASNTTSLPISRLATNSNFPANFIGMHFFSPVDRMPLVEIILGKQTSKATLEKAKALCLKLDKIPIVVHDSPAFFTSRIFFNYLLEAITMLLEGTPAIDIEREALNAGFAVSPLAVLDEITLPLMVHVYEQLPQLSNSQQRCYEYLQKLIKGGREGRKSGKGFYDYNNTTGKKQIWQDESLSQKTLSIDLDFIQTRLLNIMSLDSYRCLAEGVLDNPLDGDIGSIMGVGYAAHTGGALAHIDQVGLKRFVLECNKCNKFGEQWEIPESLLNLSQKGYTFYDGFHSNWPLTN